MSSGAKKIVLVDQDGVLADFAAHFQTLWELEFPAIQIPHYSTHEKFKFTENLEPELREKAESIYLRENFFRKLPLIQGGKEALLEMLDEGYDVKICTSPMIRNRSCVAEKYEWIREHLGEDFARRTIITKDKTLVRGDWLIDDNPEIEGVLSPSWTHVVFAQPYNINFKGPRISEWKRWKEIIK